MKRPTYSPKLRKIASQFRKILKQEGVAGTIILADGEGLSEYVFNLQEMPWSTYREIREGKAAHIKIYMKSRPEDTNKTVNAIWHLADMSFLFAKKFMELQDHLRERANIDEEKERKIYPINPEDDQDDS